MSALKWSTEADFSHILDAVDHPYASANYYKSSDFPTRAVDKPLLKLALVGRKSKLQTYSQHFAGKAMQY